MLDGLLTLPGTALLAWVITIFSKMNEQSVLLLKGKKHYSFGLEAIWASGKGELCLHTVSVINTCTLVYSLNNKTLSSKLAILEGINTWLKNSRWERGGYGVLHFLLWMDPRDPKVALQQQPEQAWQVGSNGNGGIEDLVEMTETSITL